MNRNRVITFSAADLGYSRKSVLSNVSFSLERGVLAAFLGPNGAGKTTILRTILGEISSIKGSISLSSDIRIGYVPQIDSEGSFWPLSVRDFLWLFSRKKNRDTIDEAMQQVGIYNLNAKNLQELSGGQRQKVLLAKALLNQPNVLVLDEPTQGMDIISQMIYLDLLRQLNRKAITILIVTHDLNVALSVAQKIIIVDKGTAIESTRQNLLEKPILEELYGIPFQAGMIGQNPVILPHPPGDHHV